MKTAGIDLTAVVGAVCRYLQVGEKELESTTRRLEIARARALVSLIATRELSIPGSEVALRFNIDRSAVSRAAYRVGNDAELTAAVKAILTMLLPMTSQQ